MKADVSELKDTLSSVRDLMSPIVEEIEGEEEMRRLKEENDYLDELQGDTKRSDEIEEKHEKEIARAKSEADVYEANYKKKIEARCEEQLSRGAERCRQDIAQYYSRPRQQNSCIDIRVIEIILFRRLYRFLSIHTYNQLKVILIRISMCNISI